MTPEELEKEVTEYLNTQTLPRIDSLVYRVIKSLIFGFAEPREKRFQVLEKENAELKDNFKIAKDNEFEYQSLLTKAKEYLNRLVVGMNHIAQHHPIMVAHTKIMQDLREAEQFLKECEE